MPGDDAVVRPTFNATRAITVDAAPEEIWPWIVQMGWGRAGAYSYDWIDNLGRPSARELLPEYQLPQPGDLVPFGPDGKYGLRVKAFERNKWMLWGDVHSGVTWYWGLYAAESGTRLVTRVRIRYNWRSPQILLYLALDVGDIVMMRKCLLGIKERAESVSAQRRDAVDALSVLLSTAMQSA